MRYGLLALGVYDTFLNSGCHEGNFTKFFLTFTHETLMFKFFYNVDLPLIKSLQIFKFFYNKKIEVF
jgi:hypothetical protein